MKCPSFLFQHRDIVATTQRADQRKRKGSCHCRSAFNTRTPMSPIRDRQSSADREERGKVSVPWILRSDTPHGAAPRHQAVTIDPPRRGPEHGRQQGEDGVRSRWALGVVAQPAIAHHRVGLQQTGDGDRQAPWRGSGCRLDRRFTYWLAFTPACAHSSPSSSKTRLASTAPNARVNIVCCCWTRSTSSRNRTQGRRMATFPGHGPSPPVVQRGGSQRPSRRTAVTCDGDRAQSRDDCHLISTSVSCPRTAIPAGGTRRSTGRGVRTGSGAEIRPAVGVHNAGVHQYVHEAGQQPVL
jgi:hypothetical protein